jgi:hypothetical protein
LLYCLPLIQELKPHGPAGPSPSSYLPWWEINKCLWKREQVYYQLSMPAMGQGQGQAVNWEGLVQ